jgi:ATP-dependent exoDNAse (exonuclease V) beta subunit
MKYQGTIVDPSYKHLQDFFDEWFENPSVKESYASPLAYINNLFIEDLNITAAIRLIIKHSKAGIFAAYKEASSHENFNHNLMLYTAHSSKGLQADEVIIDQGLNDMVEKAINSVQQGVISTDSLQYRDAMNLYYVACTRAQKSLVNATSLSLNYQLA